MLNEKTEEGSLFRFFLGCVGRPGGFVDF